MKGTLRLSNPRIVDNVIVVDYETLSGEFVETSPVADTLPPGFDTDKNVASQMFLGSMKKHNVDPVAVQRHGQSIVDALKADYPSLQVYLNPATDAVVWPGFGSLDVTINSGLGGWYFRPDGHTRWDPSKR
jgi:hypothetical protein